MFDTENLYVCVDTSHPVSLSLVETIELWLGVASFNSTQIKTSDLTLCFKNDIKRKCQCSSLFVLLLNENITIQNNTTQFEIETAINEQLPIIIVNLNNMWQQDIRTCPELLRYELAVHVSFNAEILKHAISNWPSEHEFLREKNERGAYYYKREVYERLGIFE